MTGHAMPRPETKGRDKAPAAKICGVGSSSRHTPNQHTGRSGCVAGSPTAVVPPPPLQRQPAVRRHTGSCRCVSLWHCIACCSHAVDACLELIHADILLLACKVIVVRQEQHAVALLHTAVTATSGVSISQSICTPLPTARQHTPMHAFRCCPELFQARLLQQPPLLNAPTLRSRIGTQGQFQNPICASASLSS